MELTPNLVAEAIGARVAAHVAALLSQALASSVVEALEAMYQLGQLAEGLLDLIDVSAEADTDVGAA